METPPAISAEIVPGLLAGIVKMHIDFYARFACFGTYFECQVARDLASFLPSVGERGNAIWHARWRDEIVGSVAIEADDADARKAHLRWFIVHPSARGGGVGKDLLRTALDHADRFGFDEIELWTFAGLDRARSLYERHGFELVREQPGSRWGREVQEQLFRRTLRPPRGG